MKTGLDALGAISAKKSWEFASVRSTPPSKTEIKPPVVLAAKPFLTLGLGPLAPVRYPFDLFVDKTVRFQYN